MTAIFLFITGIMLTWPALITLLILGIIFEANDAHMWSMFTGIVSAAVAYFFFSIPLNTLLIGTAAYFAIGFIWSFWRYKRHCDMVVTEFKNTTKTPNQRAEAIEYMKPSRMLDSITTWVIVWPFSMIENIAGDLINLVQTAITKFFKGVYSRIFDSAVNEINGSIPKNKSEPAEVIPKNGF